MSTEHPLDATVRADYEYRRLFRVWVDNPTRENRDAMNRALDELNAAADRLIALLRGRRA
jgi:hypothetical protein